MPTKLKVWWASRRLSKFRRACDNRGIPLDVQDRLLKAGISQAPNWYAGRLHVHR